MEKIARILFQPVARLRIQVLRPGGALRTQVEIALGFEVFQISNRRLAYRFLRFHQGNENVLTVVIDLMASTTPSLMPSPESLMPPKGELSVR